MMDDNRRSGRRGRDESTGQRSVLREGRATRRGSRRSQGRGVWIAVAVVALVVVVGGTVFAMTRRPASSAPASPAATSTAAGRPAATSSSATKTGSSPASAGSSASSASADATSGPAWRSADPSWMDKYKRKLVLGFKTEPGYKAVALTFDDGPNYQTQYVIDTLKKYGGHGTFFDTGRNLAKAWAVTQPSIVWSAGFEIGNHTQHHTLPDGISAVWHRTYANDLAEINGPDVYVKRGTGRNTVWLRPMGGMIDTTGVKAAVDTNHLVINWTVDSNDSHGGPRTPDYIFKMVTQGIKSGDVVLLHVTHKESMKALPRIVAELNRQGFKMVTVTELAQHSTAAITQRVPK